MSTGPGEMLERIEAPESPAASAASNGGGLGSGLASLDAIFAVKDLVERQEVPIPEWNMSIFIRGLSRGELRKVNEDDADAEIVNSRAMALALLEPSVTQAQALEILERKSMAATRRITDAIMEASGMSPGFREGAEDPVRA